MTKWQTLFRSMVFDVFTDGAARGNPGPAAIGFMIKRPDGEIIHEFAQTIGIATNNIAEYRAVLQALDWIRDHKGIMANKHQDISYHFFSDSLLAVQQLNGLFKLKNSLLRALVLKIRIKEQEIDCPITYQSIPRQQNTYVDALVNKELDKEIFSRG